MNKLGPIVLTILIISACQDGELPRNMMHEEEEFDTRCTVSYMAGNLSGEINTSIDVDSDQDNGFISYSTPTGIYVIGEQDGIELSVGINWYDGPGDYKISTSNFVEVNVLSGSNTQANYISNSGTINIQEFRSPQGEVCLRGVFSFEASTINAETFKSVSMINGEFEMTLP